ncbi:MAG: hypothetical protein ACI8W7_003702 [Gammaproteobacteria bacterium]|jgi:hypothetical protein
MHLSAMLPTSVFNKLPLKTLCAVLAGVLATGLSIPAQVGAQVQRIQSPTHEVALVELFTSEGCSSCPPADHWMSELKNDKRLWNTVVPVAFHVDYWDYIGWPDRFASPTYSNRHRDYQRYAGLRSVYTPGFLVKGEEWRGWFRYPTLNLDSAPQAGVITLDIAADGAQVQASYAAVLPTSQALELHMAVLGFDLETKIEAGENDGRTLHHDFVVLGYQRTAMQSSDSRFTAISALPKQRITAPRRALAAWVSLKDHPSPLQAAGGWLKN